MKHLIVITVLWAAPGFAQSSDAVLQAASALFDRMPSIEVADATACGQTEANFAPLVYCTTTNTILARADASEQPDAAYRVAHLLGHAIQVQHGIADIALAAIRARRDEEAALRGMVTRQVECLAGVLFAHAGLPETQLRDLFAQEPHTGSHWGRNPLRIGPKVSIGLDARAEWFALGQQAGVINVCAVDEVPVAPLLDAVKAE